MEAVEAFVEGMGEMGLTPPEALTAAEISLWMLIENGLKGSPNPEILIQSKAQGARIVARIASRIEVWPAKTTERM